MKTLVGIIVCIMILSGCATHDEFSKLDLAKPFSLNTTPPDGPYEYRKGWSDGCQSGITAASPSFYQSISSHKFTLDSNLRYNQLYNKAWQYAYTHCGFSMRTLALYDL